MNIFHEISFRLSVRFSLLGSPWRDASTSAAAAAGTYEDSVISTEPLVTISRRRRSRDSSI